MHGKTVILRGDFDLIGEQIFYRMIRTVVPEFKLEGFSAERQATDLMTEANSKDREFADELADIFYGVAHGFWVAGAVGKKTSIGLHPQYVFGGSRRGHDPHFAVVIGQKPQNVLLDAKVIGDYAKSLCVAIFSRPAHLFRPRRSDEINRTF